MRRIWTAAAVATALFAAFAVWDGGLGPEPQWVRLVRTPCLGTCPAYEVTVYRDGRVEFIGREFVAQKGKREKHIAPEGFNRLWREIHRTRFWQMAGRYSSDMTDAPHQIVTVRTDTTEKSVDDYVSGPKELTELEDMIDQVAGTREWIGDGRWSDRSIGKRGSTIPLAECFSVARQTDGLKSLVE